MENTDNKLPEVESLEKVFRLFSGKQELRKWMNHPFKQDGYYYATDGHSLVRMPTSGVYLDFEEETPKHADCGRVIPTDRTHNEVWRLADLFTVLKEKTPLIDESEECETCEGCGVIECNLGHEHDCEDCNGKGEITLANPKKVPDIDTTFRIGESCYRYELLQKLVSAGSILGVVDVLKVYGESERETLFRVGPTEILIMSCTDKPYDDDKEYIPLDKTQFVTEN